MTGPPSQLSQVTRDLDGLEEYLPAFGSAMATYDRLLALLWTETRDPAALGAPEFLLASLVAFERVSHEMLGVEYLYIVRSPESDPLWELRNDAAAARDGFGVVAWPTAREIRLGLLFLLVVGFVYDFPLAHRFCQTPRDLLSRQTRVAGWGARYYQEHLAGEPLVRQLHDTAVRFFRERLVAVAKQVQTQSMIVSKRRLGDTVGWIAP